nr:retrovirus-related Pol polyprotein from transposon TNT 1-94 [Tanacetum cinerariifolium]
MAAEVQQTLEYMGDRLNVAPILEMKNFTNCKKRKPESQWNVNERKASNLDQRQKSLIMTVLPNDQMNSVINCETAKSIWKDLILYHEGPSDVKESRVMDLKLCYNTFKFKEGETLTQTFTRYKALMNELDFQDSPDDEEDVRSSQEYMNDLEEEFHERALLSKSKRFFKKGTQRFSVAKTTDETQCHKYGRKCHFARDCFDKPSSGSSTFKSSMVKNKGLFAEAYEWDEEDVSSDDNELVEVKVLMALTNDENVVVGKESARNGKWVNITMKKVEGQINNLVFKHGDLVQELNTCKEQLLVLKQAKLDFLTMQHKRILRLDQLSEKPSSSGQTDLVFVKSPAEDTNVSIPAVERSWLSKVEGFKLLDHETCRILPAESQVNQLIL